MMKKQKSKSDLTFFQKVKRHKTLLLMCTPAVLFFFAFNYVPLPGIYVAFVKFNYRKGIFGSKFVGLDNFEFLLSSGKLWDLTRNTVLYNLAFILLGNLLAVFVAILLNEMRCKWFKKVSQTIMFLPYFISQVLIGLLVFNLLNYDTGFVNNILVSLGMERWQPYSEPGVWPVIMVLVYLWQQAGYQSVVYFAAIMGIDGEMMEAAKVDGANMFQRLCHIDFPAIVPTMVIMLIMRTGEIMSVGFEKAFLLQNSVNLNYSEIISTYTYKIGIQGGQFSYSAAIGLFNNIINLILLLAVNKIAKKVADVSLW